jgi:hypothetical protein
MVTCMVGINAVLHTKETVTTFEVAKGILSAAAMVIDTAVMRPPNAPVETPLLTRSLVVDTDTPDALPAVGAPSVNVTVTETGPAAMGDWSWRTKEEAPTLVELAAIPTML